MSVIKNIYYLTILQISNYVIPILTMPYLSRILGPEKIGAISFSLSFVGFFILISDYGFNITATRNIALNKNNYPKLCEIVSAIYIIKFIFLILLSLSFVIVVYNINSLKNEWLLNAYTYGMIVGSVLFPVWFFQGVETMKYVTYVNVFTRITFLILIFVFIKEENDYVNVALINSIASLLSGVISLFILKHSFDIELRYPNKKEIIEQLKDGWYIFLSTMSVSFYTLASTFMLGIMTNQLYVGYYDGANKIVKAVRSLVNPINQSIFPHINNLLSISKEQGVSYIIKSGILVIIFNFILSVILFSYAEEIIVIVLGERFLESVQVLKILSVIPFIVSISNVVGIQTMISFGLKRQFMVIVSIAGIVHLFLCYILIYFYEYMGVSFAVVFTEFNVSLMMVIFMVLRYKRS